MASSATNAWQRRKTDRPTQKKAMPQGMAFLFPVGRNNSRSVPRLGLRGFFWSGVVTGFHLLQRFVGDHHGRGAGTTRPRRWFGSRFD